MIGASQRFTRSHKGPHSYNTTAEHREWAQMRQDGHSLREIASQFGVSGKTVYVHTSRILARAQAQRKVKASPNRTELPNVFSPLTPDGAWVLGLWFSDGNVSPSRARLSSSDWSLIESVRRLLGTKLGASKVKVYAEGVHHWRLAVNYAAFSAQFAEFGLLGNKARSLEFPEIRGSLVSHFVRGLWDGDGSIQLDRMTGIRMAYTTSSFGFALSLRDVVHAAIGGQLPAVSRRSYGDYYDLAVHGSRAVALGNWLYASSNESTRLDRKYDRFVELRGGKS